ncbi:MAG TPA: sulfotransferase, partial [Gammaproteobacteria bacterium]|nr:sulfotransferase [Gammaproteobacteria bacterium]
WTIGSESHRVIDAIPELHPGPANNYSNRLTKADAGPEVAERLRMDFLSDLRTHNGRLYDIDSRKPVRFLEKTPKNALRIPFLDAVFPGARYIYLYRDPRENISSIMEGWRSKRFVTYPGLSVFAGPWSFLLPEDWASVRTSPLEEVAAFQWRAANECILDDLAALEPERSIALSYAELLAGPGAAIERLCEFAGIPVDAALRDTVSKPLKASRYTLTAPEAGKWRKNEAALARVLPGLNGLWERIQAAGA